MAIADDEFGGAATTENALFAAAAGRSLVNAGRKLAGGFTKRVAQAFCRFAAGTLVATAEGLCPVEDIEVGDEVWARSEETQELALKPVTALIRPHERVIWTVVYEIDEGTAVTYAEFDTTDDHPWASTDGTWLRTDELKPGMQIQRAHGVPARVMSVVETGRTEQTYNLEVADFHTYFVGEAWVWVHNNATCFLLPKLARNPYHHIFPQRADLAREFKARGINIHDNTMQIPKGLHDEIHSGGPKGGAWNQAWEDFFKNNPNANATDIYKEAGSLIHQFEIPGGPVVPYPR